MAYAQRAKKGLEIFRRQDEEDRKQREEYLKEMRKRKKTLLKEKQGSGGGAGRPASLGAGSGSEMSITTVGEGAEGLLGDLSDQNEFDIGGGEVGSEGGGATAHSAGSTSKSRKEAEESDDRPSVSGYRDAMGEFHPEKGTRGLTVMSVVLPGPADYDPKVGFGCKSSGPQYSIQGKYKSGPLPPGPGTGKYDVRKETGWDQSQPTLKGKGKINPYGQEIETPGPGALAYDARINSVEEVPGYTIQGKIVNRVKEGPAPNSHDVLYSCEKIWKKEGKTFGLPNRQQDRDLQKQKKLPGPAHYTSANADMQTKRGIPQYTIPARCQLPKPQPIGPGPGHYGLPSQLSKEAHTIGIKKGKKSPIPTPGPASYVHERKLEPKTGVSISGRPMSPSDEIKALPPGPTKYNIERCTGKDIPNYSFRSKVRPSYPASQHFTELSLMDNPAANHYEAPDSIYAYKFSKAPEYTMQKKTELSKDNFPGPCEYEVNGQVQTSKAPAYTFPKSKLDRVEKVQKKTKKPYKVGPGHYDINRDIPGPMFSLGDRTKQLQKEITPAPSDYEVKPPFKKLYELKQEKNVAELKKKGNSFKGRPSPYVYSGFQHWSPYLSSMPS
eukprot:Nk52_evm4s106 gene=Nk52_evmTU4s106